MGRMIQIEGISPRSGFTAVPVITRQVDVVGPKWLLVGSEGLAGVKSLCRL